MQEETVMKELNTLSFNNLPKLYSVETINELKQVILEEEIEDIDDIDQVALDVLRASGF